jgi:hypothetical protein
MTTPVPLPEPPDFSLVLGGPIFQLFRRSHLSGGGLELLHRRSVVFVLVAWLPLLLLSMLGGHLLAGTVRLPFLHDIEAHVRLLVALPVLIVAELIVHSRIHRVVKAFLARRIVRQQDVPRFLAAIDSATRLRNSVPMELGLVVLVFTTGQWLWRSQIALGAASTWYAMPQVATCISRVPVTGTPSSAFRFFSSFCCAGICGFLSGFGSCGRFRDWICTLFPLTPIARAAWRSWVRVPTPSAQSCSPKARCCLA